MGPAPLGGARREGAALAGVCVTGAFPANELLRRLEAANRELAEEVAQRRRIEEILTRQAQELADRKAELQEQNRRVDAANRAKSEFLALHDAASYREAALAAGADAFVGKSEMGTNLLPAIYRVAHRVPGRASSEPEASQETRP